MIIYVLLDAFRGDYITQIDTPFLHSITKDDKKNVFYRDVIPSLSFCERTEIFSGLEPEKSLFFTAFEKNPQCSEFKAFKLLLNALHAVEISLKFKGKGKMLFRKVLGKFFKIFKIKAQIYNIPLNEIWKYALSEDYDDIRNAPFENNIFKLLSNKDIRVLYKTFTSLSGDFLFNDEERFEYVRQGYSYYDFIFLYVGGSDAMGHKYGPSSKIFSKYLFELDGKLKNLVECIDENNNYTFIINGDHGMSDILFDFDIKKHLEVICNENNTNLSTVELFIDSTVCRVYSSDENIKRIILNDKLLNTKGSFVYQNSSPTFKELYGDIIWCINTGGLIFPNYFQFSLIKGMHGYIPSNHEHYGTLIIKNPQAKSLSKKRIKLTDVNKIIRNEINERFKN